MRRFMLNEYNYFRTLQDQPGISMPQAHFLAYDEFTDRSVIIMEDLKEKDAWQRYQVEGHTLAEAMLVLEYAGALHGRHFNRLEAEGVDWLRPFAGTVEYMAYNKSQGEKCLPMFLDVVAEHGFGDSTIAATLTLFVEKLDEFYFNWRPIEEGGGVPSTLCHGDLRADNVFFTFTGSEDMEMAASMSSR